MANPIVTEVPVTTDSVAGSFSFVTALQAIGIGHLDTLNYLFVNNGSVATIIIAITSQTPLVLGARAIDLDGSITLTIPVGSSRLGRAGMEENTAEFLNGLAVLTTAVVSASNMRFFIIGKNL